MKTAFSTHVLTSALAIALSVFVVNEVHAQSVAERRAARAAEKNASKGNSSKKAEPMFPQAARQEPETKASSKLSAKLQKMIDANNEDKPVDARKLADEIIADAKANAYEKSLAAQIGAQAAYGQDDSAAAKNYLNTVIQTNGLDNNGHYQSMYMLAQLQMQDEQYADALKTIDTLLAETKSDNPEYLVNKGNALYRLERYQEAAPVLKQAIDKAGPEAKKEWTQLLMATYFDLDQPQQAATIAEQLLAKDPNDKNLQLNLASIYMQGDQTAKAIALLEKLRTSGQLTTESEYRNLYAMYMNAEGQEAKALDVLKEGLSKKILKEDFQTNVAQAQAYYQLEQVGQAIEFYKKAAPLAPDGETYLNLARLLWQEQRIPEAKQAAQQAIDKGIKNPEDAKKILNLKG